MRWVLLFGLAGCAGGGEPDNMPGPSTLGAGSSSDNGAATETPVMGTTEDGDEGDESETTAAPPPASTSGMETTTGPPLTTGPADSGTSEGPPMCVAEAEDEMCVQCIKEYCCPEYDTCTEDENCSCALDCINAGGMAEVCASDCGTSAAVTELFVCGYLSCQVQCDGI